MRGRGIAEGKGRGKEEREGKGRGKRGKGGEGGKGRKESRPNQIREKIDAPAFKTSSMTSFHATRPKSPTDPKQVASHAVASKLPALL